MGNNHLAVWRKKGHTLYPGFWTRAPLALVAAHLIITHEDKHSFSETYFQVYYYVALVLSAIIAYGLIEVVVWVTRCLDYHYPWRRSYPRRFIRQLAFGVFAPTLPATLLATIYFACYGINIFDTVYFSRYFQQILFLLAAFNGYLYYYWTSKNKDKSTPRAAFINKDAMLKDKDLMNIAYFFTEGKSVFYKTFAGEKLYWPLSLAKSITHLPTYHFVQLRQELIVNRATIRDVDYKVNSGIKVTLIQPFGFEVMVSQRKEVYFKKWYAPAPSSSNQE